VNALLYGAGRDRTEEEEAIAAADGGGGEEGDTAASMMIVRVLIEVRPAGRLPGR
jgi:hypothetical protein